MAWLAMAVTTACGGAQTAGSRPGIVANGGGAPGSGGSNGATGNGGSDGTTGGADGVGGGGDASGAGGASSGGGTGGSLTDAGTVADALPPFDGGTCADNASQNTDPNMTAASGTFSGAMAGAVCAGGAFANVESQSADDGGAPSVHFFIYSSVLADAPQSIRFQSPADATSGLLVVEIGLPSASPGTYAQAVSCGNVVLLAYLPAPDPSICATDAPVAFQCPEGCESSGIYSCQPIPPQRSYAALGASDCVGDDTTPSGSWTLTLTSLTPDPKGPDTSGVLNYAPHGSLSATLPDEDPDGGATGVSLSLTF